MEAPVSTVLMTSTPPTVPLTYTPSTFGIWRRMSVLSNSWVVFVGTSPWPTELVPKRFPPDRTLELGLQQLLGKS
jgi:hypothetical protein